MKLLAVIFIGLCTALLASEKPFYEVTDGDRKFLAQVLSAVEKKDVHWISSHCQLPMVVETGNGKKTINTEEELASIVTTSLSIALHTKMQLAATKPLFKNWKGVMLGDGVLWFDERRINDDEPWRYTILALGFFAYQPDKTEANQSLEPTTLAVTPRAPSSTSRASQGRGSS